MAVLLALAACGAPEYTYVTNSDDRTYLKVPATWQEIDAPTLDAAVGLDSSLSEAERGIWLEGFDADVSPSPEHLFGAHAPAPALLVAVKDVPRSVRGQVSLDTLRDSFFPVSDSARQMAAYSPSSLTGFALLADETLTPGGGLRGVHTVYRYRFGDGPAQVIDQTLYVNDDASKLYMFFVRCSAECYKRRAEEIDAVVSSFTVREKL